MRPLCAGLKRERKAHYSGVAFECPTAMTSQLKPLLDSVRDAVKNGNWLAALALTLALPDICTSIEVGDKKKKRGREYYAKWWDDNFGKRYKYGNNPGDYLTGIEVYLLRCAYLHEGSDISDSDDVKNRNATIDKFQFSVSNYHLKMHGTRVQLEARTFCLDMCSQVEKWDATLPSTDSDIQNRASELLKIYVFFGGLAVLKMKNTGSLNVGETIDSD
jgi:hypothetical protein